MPGTNKPKRLDRNRSWRVARRKRKLEERTKGTSRSRAPRPKHKGVVAVVENIVKSITEKNTEKKVSKETKTKAE